MGVNLSDFEKQFRQATKPYKRAHVTLQEFSKKGNAELDSVDLVEAASFGILLKNAYDTNAPSRFRLSARQSQPAEKLLEREHIVLSAIGMSRNDIATFREVKRGIASNYPLRMNERNGFIAVEINHDADDEACFDHLSWEEMRLVALDRALSEGANIICFGEYDFSPSLKKEDIDIHVQKIQARIDALDRPIFLVAGTVCDRDNDTTPPTCFNRARIFVNKALKTEERLDVGEGPIYHDKLNAADHLDEKISVPERPRVLFYDTIIGRIAVLICVDAYNPTVIMSLLESRASRGSNQVDYILVPSYNRSSKLYYSCQVLSLVTGSVVMFVDACSESDGHRKPAETAIFINGRLFSDLLGELLGPETAGEYVSSELHKPVRTCRISLDYLREMRASENPATPFLNQVGGVFANSRLLGI